MLNKRVQETLTNDVSMPTVLATRPTAMQNSPTSPLTAAVTVAGTHFDYPLRDDQAESAWAKYKDGISRMVTHLSTNPTRRRVTSLLCPTTLPLLPMLVSTPLRIATAAVLISCKLRYTVYVRTFNLCAKH